MRGNASRRRIATSPFCRQLRRLLGYAVRLRNHLLLLSNGAESACDHFDHFVHISIKYMQESRKFGAYSSERELPRHCQGRQWPS